MTADLVTSTSTADPASVSPVTHVGREATSGQTLLLSVPSGHNAANLLQGAFVRTLLDGGARLVVLSPFAADPRFTERFASPRLTFEPLHPYAPRPLEQAVESILSEQFLLTSRLRAVRLQRDRARLMDDWNGRMTLGALKSIVSRLPIARRHWFRVAAGLVDGRHYDALLRRHRPALVVTSTAGFLLAEVPLIYAAKRRGVPQAGVDLGWDNLSSKYHTIRPVDFLAVWNETMRVEAVRYHGLSPDRVCVAGAAQLDGYFGSERMASRSAFFSAIGGDASRRLITLATAPHAVYPGTPAIVRHLAAAVAADRLGTPAQLLVRVHPGDDHDVYRAFSRMPHVMVEKPFEQRDVAPDVPRFDAVMPSPEDRRHLAATLAHSDVVVNFASTTTIEACVVDTPVVNVGFDDVLDLPLALSIRRYYHYEHYRPVVETGAARIAGSMNDLVSAVRAYLAHPETDRGARREFVRRMYPFTDDGAGVRVARWVLELAETGGRRTARPVPSRLAAAS